MKNKTVDEKKKSITKDIAKVADKTLPKRNEPFAVLKEKINGKTNLKVEMTKERCQRATGMKGDLSGAKISTLVIGALHAPDMKTMRELEKESDQVLEIMEELQPRDGFEGLLVSQMVLIHNQAIYCISMATLNRALQSNAERFQNQAIKLMRLYNQQLETLDKHRNKGQQKMTVEHVHVHKGGQAIVGEVHQGGVTNEK